MRQDTVEMRKAAIKAMAIMARFTSNHNFTYKTREAAAQALEQKTENARAILESAMDVCRANGGATPTARREYESAMAYVEAEADVLAFYISNCQF